MSDTWNDIQAIKNRQSTLRAKMMERRKLREDIVAGLTINSGAPLIVPATVQPPVAEQTSIPGMSKALVKTAPSTTVIPAKHQQMKDAAIKLASDPEVEKKLLMVLCDISLDIPSDSKVITEHTSRLMEREVDVLLVEELLRKFATQKLISIKFTDSVDDLIVNSLDLTKLSAMTKNQSRKRKIESDEEEEEEMANKQMKTGPGPETGDIESLLSMQSTKEREEKKLNEEIQALLVTQTAKEQLLVEKFKSRGGPQLQEFCQFGTREECHRTGPEGANCKRLHFKKIIHKHTDESLGDCSFLNTCFHMDTCKESSNMAASVATTTHQQIFSGQVQQAPVHGWYSDYENNSSIDNMYAGHRHGLYTPVTGAHSAIINHCVSSGPYQSAPIPDTSHISSRSFSSVHAPHRTDQGRSYQENSPNTGNIPIDPNRPSNMNVQREMTARTFPATGNLNTNADTHPSGVMPVLHHSAGSGDAHPSGVMPVLHHSAGSGDAHPSGVMPVLHHSAGSGDTHPSGVMPVLHHSAGSGDAHPSGVMPVLHHSAGSGDTHPSGVMPVLHHSAGSGDTHRSGVMPVLHHSAGSRDIRVIPERYHSLITADTPMAQQPPLLSEMPSTSAFSYPSIPYSLTAPPPAPAASAVTSPPFTQVGDLPSFDITGSVVSYPWSLTGELFPNTISNTETRSQTKPVKHKSISGNGKKRVRRPELWKKNLTKTKKLKGEEHVSRTGNVIPAKRVETIDCSNCSFKCLQSFDEDLRHQLFEVFYSLGSNDSQKQFVCQNVQESATKVAGANRKDGAAENKRKVCRKYFLPDTDNTRKQVCSKFFCGTLAVGKTFITHALRNKQFGCYVGKEKRGKPHNKIPDLLLEPARQHINAMLAGSSCSSKKNSKKKCLDRGLNITKMHEMYKQECSDKNVAAVSLSMYRRIFHTEL